MTMADDDGQFDIDPRWEVQPQTDDGDDSDGSRRWLLPVLLAVAAAVAALIWAAGNVTGAP